MLKLDSISLAKKELQEGNVVVLQDDAARQGIFYFFAPAELITSETVCFMVNHGRGVLFAPLSEARIRELGLPMMTAGRTDLAPDFTVSVEARHGVSTGISAADRALTLRTLSLTQSPRTDLVTPGHVFPLRARQGGVLVRTGAAEAVVDLLTMSDLLPTGALCHILGSDGNFADLDSVLALQKKYGLCLLKISEIIQQRLLTERIVERFAEAKLPTRDFGDFTAYGYRSKTDGLEHLAIVKGGTDLLQKNCSVLVRVQVEDRIPSLLGLGEHGKKQKIFQALEKISLEETGVFIYIRRPYRELSLGKDVMSLPSPMPTSAATELRELGLGAQILNDLGISKVELLTNSEQDLSGLSAFKIDIEKRSGF